MENSTIKFFKEGDQLTKDQGKFVFRMPEPPAFPTVEETRRHLKQRMVAGFRILAKLGLDEGIAGHITFRDPQHTDCFWVNPFGRSFSQIAAKDLLLVTHQGKVIHGQGPLNAAAFVIHSKIHMSRPDVVAACHSHSQSGKAMASLGEELLPITQDSLMFYEDHCVFRSFGGVVSDEEEGQRIAECLGGKKAVILQNHGLLTVGQTVDEAVFWFIALDRACQVQLLAKAAGQPKLIEERVAKESAGTVGSHISGWFNFQPYYEQIVGEQPDITQ